MSLMTGAESDLNVSTTPMVSVVGTAVLRAEPDEAMVVVTLSALKDGPGQALEDVARRSEALVALLDEFGIASSDRSTTGSASMRTLTTPRRGGDHWGIAPLRRSRCVSPT
jgi:uncharacterized protein YggE